MIPKITELNFPEKDGKKYATLTHADVQIADMGEKTITTQVKIDGDIAPDFSYDWTVEFGGEKYIMPLRITQGNIGETPFKANYNLTFQHWAIYQLKRFQFVTIQTIDAGTYIPDKYVASVQLNLGDFCELFGQVLEYYYGGAITIDLNPDWVYKDAPTLITISHTKIWNVLIEAFYKEYGVRWEIVPADDNTNENEHYVINVGYQATEVSHVFQYGFDGGLLKLERQVQSEEIVNILDGRGGSKNVPFRYFKNTDPNNPDFAPDPDWVVELKTAYFPNLMGATFRSYIQGWKAAHINATDEDGKPLYPNYVPVGEANAYAPWAYRKGFTDTKFSPVEFVADEITVTPTDQDKQVEILPNFSPYIVKDSSIDKYGPINDTLDNNEDIYPTIQGTGLDIAVDVEQVITDDTKETEPSDAETKAVEKMTLDYGNSNIRQQYFTINGNVRVNAETKVVYFDIPKGKYGNFLEGKNTIKALYSIGSSRLESIPSNIELENVRVVITNAQTGEEHSASGLQEGHYAAKLTMTIYNKVNYTANVSIIWNNPTITYSTIRENPWKGTFDIWVKNIWDTTKGGNETPEAYAERVWKPVLGDSEGNEANVVFTSGNLAHEDYEFVITDTPTYDNTHTWTDKDGVAHTSEWRLTLAKSDAELEATGLYIPSTQKQGNAGDTFAFIGTEMTHVPYVVDAEKRVDDNKKDVLREKSEIKPTFVVTTDRVRINNYGNAGALIDSLKAGNTIRIADKRLTNGVKETLYLQSVTYKFREPSSDDAALNPDVEIVLGNEYAVSASPITMMQGEISALQKQVGSISNVEQIVRRVGDKTYLRKDVNDIAAGAIKFLEQSKHVKGVQFGNTYTPGSVGGVVDENANAELLTLIVRQFLSSANFRNGLTGEGWKLWMEDGLSKLEIDELTVRQVMHVFELVIDKVRAVGGQIVVSAANGKVKYVEDNEDTYRIYFDGDNYFQPNDLMRCKTFTGNDIRGYWVEIAGTGIDYVDVPKSEFENGVVPKEGDEVVLMGNTTNDKRQNLISISATEDKQPRIDILDGVHEKNFAGCLRTRLGNLDGIQDPWFGDNQPHGDGLYADNAYLKGTFLLTTGEDIRTKFEIVEGKITSEIDSVRNELTESKGLLRNPSFINGFDYWVTDVGYNAFAIGENFIWANENILGRKGSGVFFFNDNGMRVLQIRDESISQNSTDFLNKPEFRTNEKGEKVPVTVYVSFMYKVVESGMLDVSILDQEKEGFESFSDKCYNAALEPTSEYKQFSFSTLWDGTGYFKLSFLGGEIRICGLTLSTNEADTLEYLYKSLFEQSSTLVKIAAQNFDKEGNVLESSEIMTTAEGNELISQKFNEDGSLKNKSGLVTKAQGAGIYSQGPDGKVALVGTAVDENGKMVVKLTGDNIKLEGYTTINKNFHIDDDGNAQMENATVGGTIKSKQTWTSVKELLGFVETGQTTSIHRIDPSQEKYQANDFRIVAGNAIPFDIYLPDPNKYEGLELGFYTSFANVGQNPFSQVCLFSSEENENARFVYSLILGDSISYLKNSVNCLLFGGIARKLYLPINTYSRFKAIDGSWVQIIGVALKVED